MIESLWIPGLAVLATGLAVGIWAARRLAGGVARNATEDRARDLALEISDLEARREQVYRRLRGETGETPTAADRRELELSAARTLQQLEHKQGLLEPKGREGKKGRPPKKGGASEAPRPSAAAPALGGGFAARHPLVAGFLLGGGMVALIGVLIYWAVRDATPEPRAGIGAPPAVGRPPAAAAGPEMPHETEGELPITLAVELKALDERVAADPSDMMVRRERALFNLGIERYVEAFEDARLLVAADSRDIDGLYVQGVVRLTMGQDSEALQLFDQVLQLFPDHMQAMTWRGILLFRNGDSESAIESWERALELAGGSQPDIESLLRTARTAREAGGGGDGQTAASAAPRTSAAPAPTPPAAMPPAPQAAAGAFGIQLTIAETAFPPPGGVLFLSLHGAAGGPPVAVKRIDQVAGFPLDVVIDSSDSMMGQELPASGRIRARLDADGSASTRSDDDLEAEAEGRQGEVVRLVLGQG